MCSCKNIWRGWSRRTPARRGEELGARGARRVPPGASHRVPSAVGKAKGEEGGGGGWRWPRPLFANLGFQDDVAATLGIAPPAGFGGGGGRFGVLRREEKTLASPSGEDVTRLSPFRGQTPRARAKISQFGGNSGGIREALGALQIALGRKKGPAGQVNPEPCGRVLGIAGVMGGWLGMPLEVAVHPKLSWVGYEHRIRAIWDPQGHWC